MKEASKYRRLPGRGLKEGAGALFMRTTARLWLADDHVLLHHMAAYHENYRRFYFKDIQAIVATRTERTANRNLVVGGIILLLWAIYAIRLMTDGQPYLPLYLVFSGILFFFIIVNTLMGPSCKCYLRTATSREPLYSLKRMRTAQKVMDILKPLIEARQGQLTPEMAAESRGVAAPQSRPGKTTKPSAAEAERGEYMGGMHAALFALLLASSGLFTADMFSSSATLSQIGNLVLIVLLLLDVVCLVKQTGSRIARGMKVCAWFTLAYVIASYIANMALGFYLLISTFKTRPADPWSMANLIASVGPMENPAVMAYYMFKITATMALGALGMLYYAMFRTGQKAHARARTPETAA